jgi:CheY-like chemotaxis protein
LAVRTLIVEDSEPVRGILRRRLSEIGCEVVGEAGDAAEGLELFRKLSPQLITLDLVMPFGRGVDAKMLMRAIRAEAPQVAILVISAQPRSAHRSDYIREGAIEYLEKPFIDAQVLIDKLERLFPELKKKRPAGGGRRL